jgi:hypothetical protein
MKSLGETVTEMVKKEIDAATVKFSWIDGRKKIAGYTSNVFVENKPIFVEFEFDECVFYFASEETVHAEYIEDIRIEDSYIIVRVKD